MHCLGKKFGGGTDKFTGTGGNIELTGDGTGKCTGGGTKTFICGGGVENITGGGTDKSTGGRPGRRTTLFEVAAI